MKESLNIRRLAHCAIIGALVAPIVLLPKVSAQNVAQPPAVKNVKDPTAFVKRERVRPSQPEAMTLVVASQPGSASQSANPATVVVPQSPDGVKYLSSSDVHAAFEKGSPLVAKEGHTYSVSAGRRDKPGASELHEKDTDVFYILQGSATFVTGGKMVEPKSTAPGEIRGSAIEGGEVRTLTKDDVIVIPAGVPHWFKDVQAPFLYFVVKVQ